VTEGSGRRFTHLRCGPEGKPSALSGQHFVPHSNERASVVREADARDRVATTLSWRAWVVVDQEARPDPGRDRRAR
jgi:hypothetical protein